MYRFTKWYKCDRSTLNGKKSLGSLSEHESSLCQMVALTLSQGQGNKFDQTYRDVFGMT